MEQEINVRCFNMSLQKIVWMRKVDLSLRDIMSRNPVFPEAFLNGY